MNIQKIVIAGGTGFIGKYLSEKFRNEGHEVLIISRKPGHIQWNDLEATVKALDHAALLLNLAGKSVDCRYTKKNKEAILQSRIETTNRLGEALQKCGNPPPIWINSSTATIYRHAEDRPMTESTGEIGKGFSVNVATGWEKTFFDFKLPETRQVALRIAIVLGLDGGAMKPLINLVRVGLGGKKGKGNQMFSWIHIDDLFKIIKFIQSQNMMTGVFNCSSPNAVDNKTMMKSLRKVMKQKIGIPAPEWLLRIGAVLINTETELILKSRWVCPERLMNAGYMFKFPTIDLAFADILKQDPDAN